ncbi:class C sortase [Arthrobacter sp. Y-9]|uniref:class C sortase n=1 Tax=Arthrobacter sp. Y-9 TaxID=3039385 RepID=UPI002420489D|nr:class C sortase [Arthrobacter sp. Y-9]WFR84289.1 class C sortase [Arthrobacter sp. Y-9]
MMIIAALGLALLIYPQAGDWFSTISHNTQLSGYSQDVNNLEPSVRSRLLNDAREYNSKIPVGQLLDPYSQAAASAPSGAQHDQYEQQLNVNNDGVIGQLSYPALNIDLAIYHGTGDDVLGKGVGHLFGSSLPVGGPGTHSVLTSHSGIPNAELFTPLHQAKEGQVFYIKVLDRTFVYQVEKIEVVQPDDISSLKVVPGKDQVTLITCTPIGVNSNRLLLHASRIADLPQDDPQQQTLAGRQSTLAFPYWALLYVAGLLAFYIGARYWNRRGSRAQARQLKGSQEPTSPEPPLESQ